MAEDSFDVIVIGGGPGGYVAAIRAAQLGKSTAVVERDKAGGRCLNYACIPAKTMLHTAEVLDHSKNSAEIGVKAEGVELDWEALGQRRTDVSASLEGGVEGLFKKNGIELIHGEGELTEDGNVKVGDTTYEAGKVILATGSLAQADPRGRVRRPGGRHLGGMVAARTAREHRRGRRRRLRQPRSLPPTSASAPRSS